MATEQLTQMIARVDTTGRGVLFCDLRHTWLQNITDCSFPLDTGEVNMADFQYLLAELEQIRDAQLQAD